MSERAQNILTGAVIGLLIGLAYCYYKQLRSAYQNRGLLSAGADLATAGQNFYDQIKL